MIALTVDVGLAEYSEVQTRCLRATRGKRIQRRLELAVFCVISLLGAWMLARNTEKGPAFLAAIMLPCRLLFGVVTACIKKPSLKKQYQAAVLTLNGVDVEIDQESYRWKAEGKTEGVIYWPAFSRWMETSGAITLVRGSLLYMLQKSALSQEECAELRGFCLENIGPENSVRAIVVK